MTETPSRRAEPAIRIEKLTKTYGSGELAVHALRDVDLTIGAGELVVVLGPSGSGKTTLLNIIGGIDTATSGLVVVDGEEVTGYDRRRLTDYRRRRLGFVFQFFNLVPTLTALENVEIVARLTGTDQHDSRHQLEAVGLEERLHHFPSALSGGEQQRVAIARALAKHPSLLLCDEPTGSLDLETARRVLGTLRDVQRQAGLTVILVTHNDRIAAMADRIIRMRSGAIAGDTRVNKPLAATDVTW